MENRNNEFREPVRREVGTKNALEKHINILHILGLISSDMKEELLSMWRAGELFENNIENVEHMIDLYHLITDSKKVTDPQKDLQLAQTLLQGISDTLYREGGQVTQELLNRSAELLSSSGGKRKALNREIILNINTVRDRFRDETVLDRENISVIVNMLNQLKYAEK
jgi:hypothetical protein